MQRLWNCFCILWNILFKKIRKISMKNFYALLEKFLKFIGTIFFLWFILFLFKMWGFTVLRIRLCLGYDSRFYSKSFIYIVIKIIIIKNVPGNFIAANVPILSAFWNLGISFKKKKIKKSTIMQKVLKVSDR